jgi:predicted O-methyltransferase YrrM
MNTAVDSSGWARRVSRKRLTHKDRARRPLRVGAAAVVIVVAAGGLGSFLHPHFGLISAVAAATAYLAVLFGRDLALLRISAAQLESLAALSPLCRDQVYPLNPATLGPENVLTLCREITYRRPQRILEIGSGNSTLFMARCLERLGESDARITCLEHVEFWCDEVRRMVEQAGFSDRVEVLHASIVKNTVGATLASQPVSWYDLSVLPKTGDYDFVLVDGPEGGNADPLARYGAFPLLQDRLAPGTLMLLDDGVRSGETEVVQRWLELEPRLKATFLKSEDGLWAIQLPGA